MLALPVLAAALSLVGQPHCAEASAGAAAPPPRGDLMIPGGVAALFRAANLPAPRDRAHALLTLARALYRESEGASRDLDARAEHLRQYLDVLSQWCMRLAPFGKGVSLGDARNGSARARLKDLLDLVGIDLQQTGAGFRVQRSRNEEAAKRRELLAATGVPLTGLEDRLNAGGIVDLTAPGETVPLPLAPSIWVDAIFDKQVPAEALFAAVVGYRQALWLYCGLTALDDDTLSFLETTPNLLAWIYRDRASVFATFVPSLRVGRGRIDTPGGARDAGLWESLVGEKAADPTRFVQQLLTRDAGRLAWFYDTIAHLDARRQAAATFAATDNLTTREAAFRALYATFVAFDPRKGATLQPFTRDGVDPSLALNLIDVAPDGRIAGPPWVSFWEQAFDGGRLPDRVPDSFKTLPGDSSVTLAWLLGRVFQGPVVEQRARLDLVLFAGRLFPAVDPGRAFDTLVALRGFGRFPALMLVLERMGVREPGIYAEAARAAETVSAPGDRNAVSIRVVAFQGAVALLDRLREVHVLDDATATRLLRSLFAASLAEDGWYNGQIARWIDGEVLPAVAGSAGSNEPEARMMSALAGTPRQPEAPRPRPVVEWEGQTYKVDVTRGFLARLLQVRGKQGGPDLDTVLALWRIATTIATGAPAVSALLAQQAALKSAAGRLEQLPEMPLFGSDSPDPARMASRALSELGAVTKVEDPKKLPAIAQSIFRLTDCAAAEWLASVAYAVRIENPNASVLLGRDPALGHDLRIGGRGSAESERLPWSIPVQASRSDAPVHLEGSLLGLELPLARYVTTRVSTAPPPHPPTVNANDAATFMASVSLFDPFDVTDEQRDLIAGAVRRGRTRIDKLRAEPGDWPSIGAELSLDEWQRQLLPWMLAHEPDRVSARFSFYDLFLLGGGAATGRVGGWGMVAQPLDGSLSLRLPAPHLREILLGRSSAGLLATQLPDLNFRIAEFLADAHLPAALGRGVLAAALPEWLANALLVCDDDWPGLVAAAQAIKRERFEDYVATLTTDGPLVPVTDATATPFRKSRRECP